MLEPLEQEKIAEILAKGPAKLVLSNLRERTYTYKKTVICKILLKGQEVYQIARFTEKQVFYENIPIKGLEEMVLQVFPETYMQMNIFDERVQWDFKVTKKGRLLKNTHQAAGQLKRGESGNGGISIEGAALRGHNRKKRYILEEGTVVPPLVDLGIFTREGKIVRSMYDKYRQINRFLEMVEDVVKDYPGKVLHIIDFGCGKSYLTFILYYYLVNLRGYSVEMTGLDLKADVIQKCNETAKKYHYENLHFELGDINGYRTDGPVDMVVTLHACDTATDYALYNAVLWKADIILSVPCCQHEVNAQIVSDNFSLLTRYGIVKERVSALMTDAIRGNVLTYCGYRTQLLEFVDFAASPKNVLIRAVRANVSKEKRKQAKEEVERLCREFGIRQTLAELLFQSNTE